MFVVFGGELAEEGLSVSIFELSSTSITEDVDCVSDIEELDFLN